MFLYKMKIFSNTILFLWIIFFFQSAASQIIVDVTFENIRDAELTSFYAVSNGDTMYMQSINVNKYRIYNAQKEKIKSLKNVQFVFLTEKRIYFSSIEKDLFSECNRIDVTLIKKKSKRYSSSLRYCEGECLIVVEPEITTYKVSCKER